MEHCRYKGKILENKKDGNIVDKKEKSEENRNYGNIVEAKEKSWNIREPFKNYLADCPLRGGVPHNSVKENIR